MSGKLGEAQIRVLTDRGLEYCGPIETHKYELFLHLNDIEHTKTKARHPQTNGCVERLNQIIQNEFYAVAFRKKVYSSMEEMQTDLDQYMDYYNNERTNQGKYCKGKTPRETLLKGYELYDKYVIKNETSNNCETIIEDRPNHFNSFQAPKELEDEGHLQKLQKKGKEVTNNVNLY